MFDYYIRLATAIRDEELELSIRQFEQLMQIFERTDPDFCRGEFLDIVQGKDDSSPKIYLVVDNP
tara:strand:- start:357 stop:551 length:195 start_codon:yes stop_codon:yes gene_type:complete